MNTDPAIRPYVPHQGIQGNFEKKADKFSLPKEVLGKITSIVQKALISLKEFRESKRTDSAEPDDPTTAPLRDAENKLTAAKGDVIEYVYRDPGTGREFGKEIVVRQDTIAQHQQLIENTKHQLTEALLTEKNPGKVAEIKQRIALCDKELAAINNLDKGTEFISSAYARSQLGKPTASYDSAASNLCLGAPVNFRHHACEVSDLANNKQTIGAHFRVGVMTYQANGHTHLNEMKQLRELWVNNRPEGEKAIKAKIESLNKEKEEAKPGNELPFAAQRKNESINFAVGQLEQLMHAETNVITERSFYLETQFMHLLMGQVEKNESQVTDPKNQSFSLIHLALLNQKTNKTDRSGWQHNEANQMQDMQAIFQAFNGKNMIFDGKGPYVDVKGNVHMPQKMLVDGHARKMRIDANFMNVSVQGHMKNDGLQAEINKKAIAKLLEKAGDKAYKAFVRGTSLPPGYTEGLELLKKVKADLDNGKSSYQVAEDLSVALTKMGMPTSIGCMAAKDRTGFVSARTILRHLYERMKDPKSAQHVSEVKNFSKLETRFNESIVTNEGCASRVITDNTGAKKLKLAAPTLPGIGVIGRVKQASGALKEVMSPPKPV